MGSQYPKVVEAICMRYKEGWEQEDRKNEENIHTFIILCWLGIHCDCEVVGNVVENVEVEYLTCINEEIITIHEWRYMWESILYVSTHDVKPYSNVSW